MRPPFVMIILLGFIACRSSNDPNLNSEEQLPEFGAMTLSVKDLSVKNNAQTQEVFEVSCNCAVLLQLPERISDSLSGDEGFNELSDDENESSLNAYELLKRASVEVFSTPSRYIRYICHEDTLLIDLEINENKLFGYFIFFNEKKEPLIVGSDEINESVVENYFSSFNKN